MKFKALITALTLSLVMSCMAVPAFAAEDNDEALDKTGAAQEQVAEEQDNDSEKAKEEEKVELDEPEVKTVMQSTKRVKIKWNKVDDAKAYTLSKFSKKTGEFKVIKKLGKNSRSVLLKNIKPGKKTVFKVTAYGKVGKKNATGEKKVTVKTPKVLKRSSKNFKQTNAYKVIKAARKKLGCAYVSGAEGPRAFDCSGYTYYIYNKVSSVKKIGTKRFSRNSAQGNYYSLKKYDIGRNVKKAQPGDIMLFSRSGGKSGIYHAALYYGNGKIIHASSPSTGVIISYIAHRKVAAIIRLPKM